MSYEIEAFPIQVHSRALLFLLRYLLFLFLLPAHSNARHVPVIKITIIFIWLWLLDSYRPRQNSTACYLTTPLCVTWTGAVTFIFRVWRISPQPGWRRRVCCVNAQSLAPLHRHFRLTPSFLRQFCLAWESLVLHDEALK